jgi:hypothetical protein
MRIKCLALTAVLLGLAISVVCCSTFPTVTSAPIAGVTQVPTARATATPNPTPTPTVTPVPTEPEPALEITVITATCETVPLTEIIRQQTLVAGTGGPDPDAQTWLTYTVSTDALDQPTLIRWVRELYPELADSDRLTISLLNGEGLQVAEMSTARALFNGYPTHLSPWPQGKSAEQFTINGQVISNTITWSVEAVAPVAKAANRAMWVLNPFSAIPDSLPSDARQFRGYAVDHKGCVTVFDAWQTGTGSVVALQPVEPIMITPSEGETVSVLVGPDGVARWQVTQLVGEDLQVANEVELYRVGSLIRLEPRTVSLRDITRYFAGLDYKDEHQVVARYANRFYTLHVGDQSALVVVADGVLESLRASTGSELSATADIAAALAASDSPWEQMLAALRDQGRLTADSEYREVRVILNQGEDGPGALAFQVPVHGPDWTPALLSDGAYARVDVEAQIMIVLITAEMFSHHSVAPRGYEQPWQMVLLPDGRVVRTDGYMVHERFDPEVGRWVEEGIKEPPVQYQAGETDEALRQRLLDHVERNKLELPTHVYSGEEELRYVLNALQGTFRDRSIYGHELDYAGITFDDLRVTHTEPPMFVILSNGAAGDFLSPDIELYLAELVDSEYAENPFFRTILSHAGVSYLTVLPTSTLLNTNIFSTIEQYERESDKGIIGIVFDAEGLTASFWERHALPGPEERNEIARRYIIGAMLHEANRAWMQRIIGRQDEAILSVLDRLSSQQ